MGGEYELNLVAGFIGVIQDPAQGVLQPEIGWAVHGSIDPAPRVFPILNGYSTFLDREVLSFPAPRFPN
jgi:hypothetical protein